MGPRRLARKIIANHGCRQSWVSDQSIFNHMAYVDQTHGALPQGVVHARDVRYAISGASLGITPQVVARPQPCNLGPQVRYLFLRRLGACRFPRPRLFRRRHQEPCPLVAQAQVAILAHPVVSRQ